MTDDLTVCFQEDIHAESNFSQFTLFFTSRVEPRLCIPYTGLPSHQPDGGGAPVDYAALLASLKSASTLPTMSSSIAGEGGVAANALLSAAKALTSTATAERERLAVQARASQMGQYSSPNIAQRHVYSSAYTTNIFLGQI
jgi:hypothetical protein